MLSFKALALSFVFIFFPVKSQNSGNSTTQTADVLLRDLASKAPLQHRPHTGALFKPKVPPNLAGMEVSMVRLRSKNLWSRGTNASYITIPTKTLPKPYVKRILIVYQDFGNLSSYYYKIPGYMLLSSVVGFTAYDASNVSSDSVVELRLNLKRGKLIEIRFPRLTLPGGGSVRGKRCAEFDANGRFQMREMTGEVSVCYSRNEGFFAIVAPSLEEEKGKKSRVLGGFLVGVLGLVLLIGLVGFVVVKVVVMGKKIDEMEREADDGVGLEIVWINGASKMPSATVTRTHPVLENASLL